MKSFLTFSDQWRILLKILMFLPLLWRTFWKNSHKFKDLQQFVCSGNFIGMKMLKFSFLYCIIKFNADAQLRTYPNGVYFRAESLESIRRIKRSNKNYFFNLSFLTDHRQVLKPVDVCLKQQIIAQKSFSFDTVPLWFSSDYDI